MTSSKQECIGHIFDGRVGGNWRCERCGMPWADRIKERNAPSPPMTNETTTPTQERIAKAVRHADYAAFESDNFYGDAIDWPLARHIAGIAVRVMEEDGLARAVDATLRPKAEVADDVVERVARAIWCEDHYNPALCGHGGETGLITCAYCEPHDDETPNNWPADKERAERQARAALEALGSNTKDGA